MAAADPKAGGWPPVIAHAAAIGATQVLWLTYAPITTDAARAYGVSSSAVVWLANVYPVLYFVLALPVGALIDRRPRAVLTAGAVLVILAGVLRLPSGSYGAALAGQVAGSLAQPILFSGIVITARANLDEARRPAGIAVGTAGTFIGIVLGLLLPPLLSSGSGLGTLLAAEAVIAGACGLAQLWTLRAPLRVRDDELEPRVIRRLLRDPGMRALALLAFGGFGIFATLLTAFEPLLKERRIATGTIDVITLAMTLAGILTSLILPPLIARRRIQRPALTAALLVASAAVAAIAAPLPPLAIGLLALVIGMVLLPALPVLLELGEARHPDVGGTVSAIVFLAGNLGVALLTASATAMKASQPAPFLLLAVVALAALAAAWRGLRLTVAGAGAGAGDLS